MDAGGLVADEELLRDPAVAQSVSDQLEHLTLALGEQALERGGILRRAAVVLAADRADTALELGDGVDDEAHADRLGPLARRLRPGPGTCAVAGVREGLGQTEGGIRAQLGGSHRVAEHVYGLLHSAGSVPVPRGPPSSASTTAE